MVGKTKEIDEGLLHLDPNDPETKTCPARIIKRSPKESPDYLHGSRDETEYTCELTKKTCGYRGLLVLDEMINKEWVCLDGRTLDEIELYLKAKASSSVPTVQEQIDHPRKKYLDYALYAKHRGKIEK